MTTPQTTADVLDAAPPEVGCNRCGWQGEEADLVMANDAEDGELTNAACPKCLTDYYLMDWPEPAAAAERAASDMQPPVAGEVSHG